MGLHRDWTGQCVLSDLWFHRCPCLLGAQISGAEVGLEESGEHFGLFSWDLSRREMMDTGI